MKLAENRKRWISRVQAYRSSDMTVKDWCAKECLSESSLSYWITKLNKEKNSTVHNSAFVKVLSSSEHVSSTPSSVLTLHVNHFSLDIPPFFDAASLREIIGVLKGC